MQIIFSLFSENLNMYLVGIIIYIILVITIAKFKISKGIQDTVTQQECNSFISHTMLPKTIFFFTIHYWLIK